MNLNDRELLARTLEAEAGNQGLGGMLAAGSVIMNRAKSGDGSLSGVILKPGQFSAWNSVTGYAGGEQGQDMTNMTPSKNALAAADKLLSGQYEDPTGGATHYYNPSISQPKWGMSAGGDWKKIGDHVFGTAKSGGILSPNINTTDTESKTMLPPKTPQGLLSSLRTSYGMQPQDEAAGGETALPFYQRETFKDTAANLAQGFAAMGSMPALQEMTAQRAKARASKRETAASRSKTAKWLADNNFKSLAEGVLSGALPGNVALQQALSKPKDDRTSLIQNYEYFKARGLSDKEAMAQVRSGTTINTGDSGDFVYGAKAGLNAGWRIDKRTGIASVIPGGPADIESAASAEAKGAKTQDQYEKDLTFFAAGDRILNAIDEKTLIPATGTAAAVWGAVPGLGQFQKDVQEDFAQLQAQMQMAALQNLRETSQNGSSGLGQLTDAERTAIGKVKNNLTNLKSEAAAATSVRSAMLLKAYFEGGLFDPSINEYRVASESELSSMVNGVNPFGNSEGPQITSGFNQFLPKYVEPQETAPIGLTQQQLMEKYN